MSIQITYYSGGKKGVQRISISMPEPSGLFSIRDFLTYAAKNGGTDLAEIESHSNWKDSRRAVLITLNGRNIESLQGLDTRLHDGDQLSVLPVVAGG